MILVTGGTGFVGPRIIHALRTEDRDVRALVRKPERAATLKSWACRVFQGDVTDPDSLRRAAEGCEAVVHLVSIITGRRSAYERVMVEGTQNLVTAAKDAGVRRFVLMSALGVSEESRTLVPYYGAKWEMETAVKESGLEHVIFRPSFIFGRDGGVLPLFVRQVRLSPVTPVLGNGRQRLQPIWIDDVAAFFAASIDLPAAANRTFELGGPDRPTWNELYERIARMLDKQRRTVHVPWTLARVGAAVVEHLPGAPITRDQLTMLQAGDNVTDDASASETFGIESIGLDEQLRRGT
jgi:NADH dehydrogenase